MKKIKSKVNSKDRVVCVTLPGEHKFYYQAFGSKIRTDLFENERIPFSGPVFAYFRDNGRCMDGRGFSLTVKELYEERKSCRNPKIAKLFERLPVRIDQVLKVQKKHNVTVKKADKVSYDDRELAA